MPVDRYSTPLPFNNLPMPHSFPSGAFGKVSEGVLAKQRDHVAYEHFSAAWTAVPLRFRGAYDSGETFKQLLETQGHMPPPLERYEQERTLFEFYSSGFSVFEATCFALFAIGAMIVPRTFVLTTDQDLQRITPKATEQAYVKAFAPHRLTSTLRSTLADAQFRAFREKRNVLTHRAAPGRKAYLGLPNDASLSVDWKLTGQPLSPTMIDADLAGLARLLDSLLAATMSFVDDTLT